MLSKLFAVGVLCVVVVVYNDKTSHKKENASSCAALCAVPFVIRAYPVFGLHIRQRLQYRFTGAFKAKRKLNKTVLNCRACFRPNVMYV